MIEALATTHLTYPNIDPIIFQIGSFALRWYSLAYIGGLLFGWWYIRRMLGRPGAPMSVDHIDDFITWATIGVIAGGRLGYVLFYNFSYYISNPIDIFKLWDGGMSFHGGAIGVILAVIFYSRKHKLNMFAFADYVAMVSPVALLLGRAANFINGELWGRPTDAWYGMIFPADRLQLVRHPSQLYEAFLEGIVLFAVLWWLSHKTDLLKKPGFIAGIFYIGYALTRFAVEYAREPDQHIGLMWDFISRGQILSLPTLAFGLWLIWQAQRPKSPMPK